MAEFERVPLRPRPKRNWLPSAGVAFAVFLVLVIAKPWETSRTPAAGDPTARPTFFIAPTERTGQPEYNPLLFGLREPDPAWELWPAGYVVRFGMAGPLKVTGDDGASPAPSKGASGAPSPGAPSLAAPSPATSASAAPSATEAPAEPGVIDLGPSDHLVALGINTPLDFRVISIDLAFEAGEDCCLEAVPYVHLPTFWESEHFVVIAPEDPSASGQPDTWKAGEYVLYLAAQDGELREIRFVVRPAGG